MRDKITIYTIQRIMHVQADVIAEPVKEICKVSFLGLPRGWLSREILFLALSYRNMPDDKTKIADL